MRCLGASAPHGLGESMDRAAQGGVRDLEGASNTVRAPEGGEQALERCPKRRAARLGREHHGTGRPPFTLIVSPIT
jgi:hypothetical protein